MISPIIPITFAIAMWLVASQNDQDERHCAYEEVLMERNVPAPYMDFKCGVKYKSNVLGGKIVSGSQSEAHEYPWMVAMYGKIKGEFKLYCGGTLINRRWVLTAAYCALDMSLFYGILGEHNIREASGKEYKVEFECFEFHPKYNRDTNYHDAALLRLRRRVIMRTEVSPICLPWGLKKNADLIGQHVTIAGWGHEIQHGDPSSILLEVNVTVFNPRFCHDNALWWSNIRRLYPSGLTVDNIMCVLGNPNKTEDSCKGDSGGPAMHYDLATKTYVQAGIISYVSGCDFQKLPGILTPLRNTDTLEWIKDIAFSQL